MNPSVSPLSPQSLLLTHLSYFIFPLFLISCHTYYLPGSSSTAIHDGAGDMEVAGYAGTSGFDGHFFWAPIDHIGLTATGSYNAQERSDTVFDHAHTYGELAVGLYSHDGRPFTIGVNDNIVQVGVMGGFGSGTFRERWYDPPYPVVPGPVPDSTITLHRSEAFIHRYYVQLSLAGTRRNVEIHIKEKQPGAIDAGLLLRYVWVDHRSYTTTDSVPPPRMMRFVEYIFWGQVRLDAAALEVQFGGGSPRERRERYPDFISSYGSIGVRLLLNELYD